MSTTAPVQEIFDRAMALSLDEREELLRLLVNACEPSDPEWWASVEPEVEERIAALESGEDQGKSLDEVRKWLFERVSAARD